MHGSVLNWMKNQIDENHLQKASVLEIGSLNVNGSIRDSFEGPYVGIDQTAGKDVDVVTTLADYKTKKKFDVILSLEMLEHDRFPWESVKLMKSFLADDGILFLTTRGIGFGFHEYPIDCTRWTVDGITALFEWAGWTDIEVREDPDMPGVFVKARK